MAVVSSSGLSSQPYMEYHIEVSSKEKMSQTRRMQKADAQYIQRFVPLVRFLGEVLGPQTEVVLHDASKPDKSVIAIANGHVSGRQIGSPATDLMLKVMRDGTSSDQDFVVGYEGRSSQNSYMLRSSTFFIRNGNRIIGTLCINTDKAALLNLQHAVTLVTQAYFPDISSAEDDDTVKEENLIASVDDIATQVVADLAAHTGVPASQFSIQQRLQVIRELCDHGYFNFKGSISKVAQQLSISESTAYRYLRIVQNTEQQA